MFIPKVWFEGRKLFVQANPTEAKEYAVEGHSIDLGIGEIKSILQKEQTVYVHGDQRNVIVAHVHSVKIMKIVSPYSIDVPTWMKIDFENFIESERE